MADPTPTPADLDEAEQLLRSPQDFESADAPHRPDLLTFAAAARTVLAKYDRRAQALAEAEEGRVAAVELWQRTVRDLAPAAAERDRLSGLISDMVARISMRPSDPLLPWPELPQDLAFLATVIDTLRSKLVEAVDVQGALTAERDRLRSECMSRGADLDEAVADLASLRAQRAAVLALADELVVEAAEKAKGGRISYLRGAEQSDAAARIRQALGETE